MYFAIFHFYGCKDAEAHTLDTATTAGEAIQTAAATMADNNSREQVQRTPFGCWIERAFIYNAAGDVVAMIEQQPSQPQPQIVTR